MARPPSGPLWVHEIKHDGCRLIVRWDGLGVRCFTRNGHDWADRLPAIVDAARIANGKPAGVSQRALRPSRHRCPAACLSRLSGSGAAGRLRSVVPQISQDSPASQGGGFRFCSGQRKARQTGRANRKVKLGNRNADNQTSASRSVRLLLNRRASIPFGKIARTPPVKGVELGGDTEGTLPRLEFLCAVRAFRCCRHRVDLLAVTYLRLAAS